MFCSQDSAGLKLLSLPWCLVSDSVFSLLENPHVPSSRDHPLPGKELHAAKKGPYVIGLL